MYMYACMEHVHDHTSRTCPTHMLHVYNIEATVHSFHFTVGPFRCDTGIPFIQRKTPCSIPIDSVGLN